jgi:ribosomal protein L30/L7E
MQLVGTTGFLNILNAAHLQRLVTLSTRSYYKKKWTYDDKYMGKFDYHDKEKYPRRLGAYKEEELLDEVHAIRNLKIDKPSPFHVITRISGHKEHHLPWTQQVILRRLNIHSSYNGDIAVVPNTPQYNSMINKVKHLVALKPATFADGKMLTEDDIGAVKVCQFTGKITIDEKLRLRGRRLNLEKPLMFQGNFLRHKLNKMHGTRNRLPIG